jgi:glycosyltransferase involved in cell wall biosynthesis
MERGFDECKCFTVENGIRGDFFAPSEKANAVRIDYGWEGQFVAMYIGAHGVSQGLYTLLDAAERLQEREEIRFVFVGDGADKPGLMAHAERHGLRNVDFLPLQDRKRMPLFYGAADVCLVPLKQGPYFRINIPSKIFEILACERPIVLGAEGQARSVIEESGGGIAVTPEGVGEYVAAILRLHDDPEQAAALGRSGREYVLRNFTRKQKAERYLAILKQALGGDEGRIE